MRNPGSRQLFKRAGNDFLSLSAFPAFQAEAGHTSLPSEPVKVKWSDSSSTAVTKSHRELQDFLLKLCKEKSAGSFEHDVIGLLSRAEGEHRELERMLR
ncbi:zinc finger CCHC domain-containing protein 2 isoform X1 [Tachysurus ichikawai]